LLADGAAGLSISLQLAPRASDRPASIHELPRRGLLGNSLAQNWIFTQPGRDFLCLLSYKRATYTLDVVAMNIYVEQFLDSLV
jgi:hypothetical protein